jgi:acyl-CoA hydrolase
MSVLMTPDRVNLGGSVHGSTILKLLDQVAYACASRYAGRYAVTPSVDRVMFREAIHVGKGDIFTSGELDRSHFDGHRYQGDGRKHPGSYH